MGAYDSMRKSMLPTGLYRLDGSTLADSELQAYAAALDPLRDDLNKLQNESFTATASDYGLRCMELALGVLWPADDAQGRRKTIFALGAVGTDGCGRAALEKLLAGLGVNAEIAEDVPNRTLTFHVKSEPAGGTQAWEQIVGRFIPAHVQAMWDYTGLNQNTQPDAK